jgi:hypothetical protein
MDDKKLLALAKKNAAKSTTNSAAKNFGKKYDATLPDDPKDEESLKEREERLRFFKEMKKRDF